MQMSKIYKNWTVHNLFAHPIGEIVYLLTFGKGVRVTHWIHDVTLPLDHEENGRG